MFQIGKNFELDTNFEIFKMDLMMNYHGYVWSMIKGYFIFKRNWRPELLTSLFLLAACFYFENKQKFIFIQILEISPRGFVY